MTDRRSIAGRCAAVFALFAAAACTRAGEPPAQPPPAAPVAKEAPADAAAPAAAPAPALPAADGAECEAPLRDLTATVRGMENAEEGMQVYPRAVASWKAVPAACRGARWYFMGARILRYVPGPITADGTTLSSPEAALATALTGAPDADLYAFVAFTSALGEPPPLPAGACKTLLDTLGDHPARDDLSRTAYVCGQQALARGDGVGAMHKFVWMSSPGIYPDLELRKAEALAAQGKQAEARTAARAATLDPVRSRAFGATDAEHQELVRARKALGALK